MFDSLFYEASDGLILTDASLRIIQFNKTAGNMLDLSSESITKELENILIAFCDLPDFNALRQIKTDGAIDWKLIRQEPKKLILGIRFWPFKDASGNLESYLVILKDLTPSWFGNGFENKFIGLMSHKLRTPLVPIVG